MIHLPPRKADLHPLSHQPHRAQDADQAEEKVSATASAPSLCHEGPSTRCFLIRPTGVVWTPKGSAALCNRAGGCKLGTGWCNLFLPTWTVEKMDVVLKNLKNQTSGHTRKLQLSARDNVFLFAHLSSDQSAVPNGWLKQLSGWPRLKQFHHGGWPEWSSASWASLERCTGSATEKSWRAAYSSLLDGSSK